MNKVLVGILPYARFEDDNNPYTDKYEGLHVYTKRIYEAFANAVCLIPNDGLIPIEELEMCDAFLIQGGTKIEKYHFQAIAYALKNNKPILGICLGMQAITLFSDVLDYVSDFSEQNFFEAYNKLKKENDGSLLKKVTDPSVHAKIIDYTNSEVCRHKVIIKDKDSILYDILKKEELNVVSLHSLEVKFAGKKFRETAYSNDGVIEAVEYNNKDYFILGVQWHTEWDDDNLLFKRLIDEGAKRKNG